MSRFRVVRRGHPASAVPAPTGTARFLNSGDGSGSAVTAPIVGQVLFIDPGPFSNSPTSYDYTVYVGGTSMQTGTFTSVGEASFLVDDSYSADQLQVKCHGINGSGTSSTTSDSALTTAVADIDLTNAITAFSRTSASGVTPITLSITYGSNVREGYTRRWNVYSDSGKSTLLSTASHVLTYDDLQSSTSINLTAEGLSYTATDWIETGVEATSPAMIWHQYLYGTPISPTDASIAMVWSTTDKTSGATLSNGNLTVTDPGGSNTCHIRGSRVVGYDKTYWEVTVGAQYCHVGVADGGVSLPAETNYWGETAFGHIATSHACTWSGNDNNLYYNGVATNIGAYTGADKIAVAWDRVNEKIWFRKNTGSWLPSGDPAAGTGGFSCPGLDNLDARPYLGAGGGGFNNTANFGTTPGGTAGFTNTPPTGFVAP